VCVLWWGGGAAEQVHSLQVRMGRDQTAGIVFGGEGGFKIRRCALLSARVGGEGGQVGRGGGCLLVLSWVCRAMRPMHSSRVHSSQAREGAYIAGPSLWIEVGSPLATYRPCFCCMTTTAAAAVPPHLSQCSGHGDYGLPDAHCPPSVG
jgi:hypothetical protein